MSISYRAATRQDLLGIGAVYLCAFPESLTELRSPDLSPQAVADVAAACLIAEPECIDIAETGQTPEAGIIGYIIAPSDTSRPGRLALRRGLPLMWVWRWITGRYRLSLRGALALFSDKLHLREAWRLPGTSCGAAVLSLAVDPGFRGQGIGRQLLERAVSRVRELGCDCLRLEVRPDNVPARRLYDGAGFRRVGGFTDSRGSWEIMLLQLREPEATNG